MKIETVGVWIALFITAAIGFWATFKTFKKNQTDSEYFTAFGSLDKKRIFFSVFATTFSAFTVVGLPAMFYAHGIGTFLFMGVGMLGTPLIMWLIGRKITELSINSNNKFSSPVGLLTSGYDSKPLTIILSLTTIVVLFPYLTLQIAGIGKFLVSISDGSISYLLGTILCCLVVAVYIYSGGAKADAETDLIQGIILVVGTIVFGCILFTIFFSDSQNQLNLLNNQGLLTIPGPKNYFTFPLLFSYGIIFTLITVSTPQVSQKLMGIKNTDDIKPILIWYPIIGIIILFFAGLIGLYAAANLKVSTPDFVTGDVLRKLSDVVGNEFHFIFFFIAVLFIAGVISAAVSTIDSLLLAVTGIIRDNFPSESTKQTKQGFRLFTIIILVAGIIFSSKPPTFIVSLAQIQLAGLTALLPCLLGPLFGIKNRYAGWLSLILGLLPIIIGNIFNINYFGFDTGIVGLIMGLLGLFIGRVFFKSH
jgi:Na+/proline symporter